MARLSLWITVFAAFTLVPAMPAFAAEPDPPTATFTSRGAPPVSCGSRPNVASLTVPTGTQLLVINETEVDAAVVVDGHDILTVPDGGGALLTLSAGAHVVTMAPTCLHQAGLDPLTVTVTGGVTPTTSAPAEVPSTDAARASEPSAATPPAGAPIPEAPAASTPVAAPIPPTQPAVSAPASPSPMDVSDLDTGWDGVDATLVDLGRGESQIPRLVTAVVVLFLLGVVVGATRAFIRLWRKVSAERRRRERLAAELRRQQEADVYSGSANDLRDRLRELVQAAHRGVDPRKVAAERAELFAENPMLDED